MPPSRCTATDCLVYFCVRFLIPDAKFGWNPHKVELALWTKAVAEKLGISLPQSSAAVPSDGDKKRKASQDENGNLEEDGGGRRKRKK